MLADYPFSKGEQLEFKEISFQGGVYGEKFVFVTLELIAFVFDHS
jgi:hypothetical protein